MKINQKMYIYNYTLHEDIYTLHIIGDIYMYTFHIICIIIIYVYIVKVVWLPFPVMGGLWHCFFPTLYMFI